jgi:hypothetical protein
MLAATGNADLNVVAGGFPIALFVGALVIIAVVALIVWAVRTFSIRRR